MRVNIRSQARHVLQMKRAIGRALYAATPQNTSIHIPVECGAHRAITLFNVLMGHYRARRHLTYTIHYSNNRLFISFYPLQFQGA